MSELLAPIHPGEVLLEDFLKPMGMTQYRLARSLGVPPRRVNEIVLGRRAITPDTALRLGRFFGTSAEVWMNLQSRFDLETAKERMGGRLEQEVSMVCERAPRYGTRRAR
jgi:addiction module HigA family antidote